MVCVCVCVRACTHVHAHVCSEESSRGGAGKRTALLRLVKSLEEALLTLPNLIKINYKMSQDRGSPFDPNLRRL